VKATASHSKMSSIPRSSGINRRVLLSTLASLPALYGPLLPTSALAQTATADSGLLPSWNAGPVKQAIVDFVRATTDRCSPSLVSPEDRIAVFDQDGTLWVEHPMYTQVVYGLERVPAVVAKRPELKNVEPFKTVLSGNRGAMAKLSMRDLEKILTATLTGMAVEELDVEARKWLETAKHPRWNRPYTELVYQPMLEVNPLWGAPRIHGELLKLGFEVAESTVSKYMIGRRGPRSQSWRTFLRNHADAIAAIDLCVVPTLTFERLFAFLVVGPTPRGLPGRRSFRRNLPMMSPLPDDPRSGSGLWPCRQESIASHGHPRQTYRARSPWQTALPKD
jgi:hypothetical protein